MQSRSEAYLYIVVLCVIALVASYCREADANPVTLRYRNPGAAGDPTYQAIVVHATGLTPQVRTVNCPPGMECLVTVPMLPGSYSITLTARANGLESQSSNMRSRVVLPAVACDFDYDHNGFLTGLDFNLLLADFQQGYWTGSDFTTFVRAFNKPCAP